MLFSDIKPYVRFARYLKLTNKTKFSAATPYDARLFYTKHGNGIIEVGNKKLEMKKGNLLLINPTVRYRLKTPADSVTYIAFNFDYTQSASHIQTPVIPAWGKNYNPKFLTEHVEFSDTPELNSFVYIPNIFTIDKTAENIINEHTKRLINYELKSSCLFSEILIEIIRHLQLPAGSDNTNINAVLDYIHNNFHMPLTNRDIAQKFSFHPNYLSQLVKTHTGLPMHKYLLQVRLTHASQLLESGNSSISKVAQKCGFSDVYHFSRYFKEVMKVTPSEFSKTSAK